MATDDYARRELTRRNFLKIGGAGLAGAALGGAISGPAAVAQMTQGAICQAGKEWTTYPGTEDLYTGVDHFFPRSTCAPASLQEVVAIVREAEAAGRRVHASGSRWSFSDCAFTGDYVVDTKNLKAEIQTVQRALRPGRDPRLLYHGQAGITIRELYERLAARTRSGGTPDPLALRTMGGASGQTLAGAVSTGTHGGDKRMAPLADSVAAIHLVGAGGTQYWIEPSRGITDLGKLRERVVPGVKRKNVVYDDATFDACLVSMGCMGIIYAVVLRVDEPYDLAEETIETTWRAFKADAPTHLADPGRRFLQVLLDPYTNRGSDNYCLLTTRYETPATRPEPTPAKRPDPEPALKATIEQMLYYMNALVPGTLFTLHHNGVLDVVQNDDIPDLERLAALVEGILAHTPYHRPVLVAYYARILSARYPPGTFGGPSYSVMDLGYGDPIPESLRGYSTELHFPALDAAGRPGFARFIDDLIAKVNAATQTFFAGYVSMRFTGATRASLGMQRWAPTCTVEISAVQGVRGLHELLTLLFRTGFTLGGLAHWGQELDLGVRGHGSLYARYGQWRRIYAKMSDGFAKKTFENGLSERWNLTTRDRGPFEVAWLGSGDGVGGYDLADPADSAFGLDYEGSGQQDHLALYRPGRGTFWVLRNNAGTYSPVYAEGSPGRGVGGYDLADPADRAFAFDHDKSGRQDHVVLYRPGRGTVWILRNNGGTFAPVYAEGSPGRGIGGYDLADPADRIIAFDYASTGRLDHLLLYRPGFGTVWILRNEGGGVFVPVYAEGSPGNGIGGYDLRSPLDRAFALDYAGSGKVDHLVLYRPGFGTIWILKNDGGRFVPVHAEGSPGNGIGGYDLADPADRAFALDYAGSGKQDHIALYRPGFGTMWVLRNEGGRFSPVYAEGSPGRGVGGYDLGNPADQALAFDHEGSGKQDHLGLYRPGSGTMRILRKPL